MVVKHLLVTKVTHLARSAGGSEVLLRLFVRAKRVPAGRQGVTVVNGLVEVDGALEFRWRSGRTPWLVLLSELRGDLQHVAVGESDALSVLGNWFRFSSTGDDEDFLIDHGCSGAVSDLQFLAAAVSVAAEEEERSFVSVVEGEQQFACSGASSWADVCRAGPPRAS